MQRIVWRFGLISGGIFALTFVVSMLFKEQLGFDNGAILGYAAMLVSFLMVYFGVRAYRDTELNGSIRFGRAFGVGLLITLVGCAFYVASWEIVYFKFTPDFADKYAEAVVKKTKASGATPEKVAATQKEMDDFKVKYQNPLYNSAVTFMEPFPIGLVMTLISAGILSRRRRTGAVTSPA